MKKNSRTFIISLIVGLIIAFCYEIGARIGAEGINRLPDTEIYLRVVCKSLLYGCLIFMSWAVLPVLIKKGKCKKYLEKLNYFLQKVDNHRLPIYCFILFFMAAWLPAFLAIFPGAFAYDAPTEWQQFVTGQINTHHPVLHTLLIGIFLEAGNYWGSYNAGIAAYTIFQMLVMAAIFSYTISFLRRYMVSVILRFFAILFWGFSPVVHLFVVSSTKDTLFSGVLLLFILNLVDFGCKTEEFLTNRSRKILFAISAFLTMTLRNNGFYIVLITLILMLITASMRKRLLPLIICILITYIVYVGPVYRIIGVEKGEICEMLSVPLQQMARTYMYNYDKLEGKDIELLEAIVPKEDLLNYVPTLADPVKRNFREDIFKENSGQFFLLWIKWGIQNPNTYVQAFLVNTSGYWYPHAIINGYDAREERTQTDYSRYSVGAPGKRVEMLPSVYELYRALSEDRSASEAPMIFLLISPGWYLLMTLYICAGFWNNRRKEFLLPSCAVFAAEITALLGPVVQVRYVLILFFAFPVMLSLPTLTMIDDKTKSP